MLRCWPAPPKSWRRTSRARPPRPARTAALTDGCAGPAPAAGRTDQEAPVVRGTVGVPAAVDSINLLAHKSAAPSTGACASAKVTQPPFSIIVSRFHESALLSAAKAA